MKELLTQWIVNLTLFSLFSSVLNKLVPGKTYIPYIRIFNGIMMILILFQPMLKLGGLEQEIEFHFMEEIYETELKQMENILMQVEKKQKAEWEEAIKSGEEQSDGMENED